VQRHCADTALLAANSAPRRFQDGLPIFKSFDRFSDFSAVRARADLHSHRMLNERRSLGC
jgi:hypothetical protein